MEMREKILSQVIKHMYGLIVVDDQLRLLFIDKSYAGVLGLDPEKVVGSPIVEVIPTSRLPQVIKTGRPILGEVFHNGHSRLICNRLPLRDGEKVIGAFSYWVFEVQEQLVSLLESLKEELAYYKEKSHQTSGARYQLSDILGESVSIQKLKSSVLTAAPTNSVIFIYGETGTGKELVAHSIHQESRRFAQPFIKINCAAIPPDLLESELFGYEEGAFTGASRKGKKGRFELAHKGTIFLDEIHHLSLAAQAKLLRVLQEKEVDKLGGSKPIPIDVRIIACTNIDIEERVQAGNFRKDLFYRLNVIPIQMPTLYERLTDLPILAKFFAQKYGSLVGLPRMEIDPNVFKLLTEYHWPGNVRELEHTIERAISICEGERLRLDDFYWIQEKIRKNISPLRERKLLLQKDEIIYAIEKAEGNKARTARMLGISRQTLYKKIKQLEIQ